MAVKEDRTGVLAVIGATVLVVGLCLADADTPALVPTLAPPRTADIAEDVFNLHNWDRLWNIRVKDGDTIQADIDLGRGIVWQDRTIRLKDFDAWESTHHRKTVVIADDEIAKGKKAEAALEACLMGSRVRYVLLGPGKTAEYGREEGAVYAVLDDGEIRDAAQWMRDRGHERTVKPDGTKRSHPKTIF